MYLFCLFYKLFLRIFCCSCHISPKLSKIKLIWGSENYGYCLAEALIHKCHVVARKGLSHDEFLPMQFLFDNEKVRDFDITSDLMATFNTSDWPTVNEVDTNGAENIARSLERLVL